MRSAGDGHPSQKPPFLPCRLAEFVGPLMNWGVHELGEAAGGKKGKRQAFFLLQSMLDCQIQSVPSCRGCSRRREGSASERCDRQVEGEPGAVKAGVRMTPFMSTRRSVLPGTPVAVRNDQSRGQTWRDIGPQSGHRFLLLAPRSGLILEEGWVAGAGRRPKLGARGSELPRLIERVNKSSNWLDLGGALQGCRSFRVAQGQRRSVR